MTQNLPVLIVPGLRNSGPVHWQSLWQLKYPEYVRLMQRDWGAPNLALWTRALDRALRRSRPPYPRPLLVAHSFGCLAVVNRIAQRAGDIAGALLVAPADPERFGLDDVLSRQQLGVPTLMVGSRNDPWLDFRKAQALARRWGSRFVDLGLAGHINSESGYGPWPEGERLKPPRYFGPAGSRG
jgi:hypothetical protein